MGEVGLLFGGRQFAGSSLQAVVDRLGNREEGLVASDQLPVGQKTQVTQEGYLGAEDLGDPAAIRGGVDVNDTRALQGSGEFAQLGHSLGTRAPLVEVQVLRA